MRSKWGVGFLVAVACLAVVWTAPAQIDREKTVFTTNEPLAVGSEVLTPGTYRIQVVKLSYNRNIVQVTDKEGTKVVAQVLATPHPIKHDEMIPESLFAYYPATATKPKALRTWFAPNTPYGQDIVYPKGRAEELAAASNENVPAMPEMTREAEYGKTPIFNVTPKKTEEPYVEAIPDVQPHTHVASAEPKKLPRTASREPLLALGGLLAVGGALAARALSRR